MHPMVAAYMADAKMTPEQRPAFAAVAKEIVPRVAAELRAGARRDHRAIDAAHEKAVRDVLNGDCDAEEAATRYRAAVDRIFECRRRLGDALEHRVRRELMLRRRANLCDLREPALSLAWSGRVGMRPTRTARRATKRRNPTRRGPRSSSGDADGGGSEPPRHLRTRRERGGAR